MEFLQYGKTATTTESSVSICRAERNSGQNETSSLCPCQTSEDSANAFSSLPNSLHVRSAEKVFRLPLDIRATLAYSSHTPPAGTKTRLLHVE